MHDSKTKGKAKTDVITDVIPRIIRRRKHKRTIPRNSCSAEYDSAARNLERDGDSSAGYGPAAKTHDPKIFRAVKGRSHSEGYGSLGVKALHMKVQVDSLDAPPIQGKLDSGADITLISEEFWKSLPSTPRIKEGI